MGRNPVVVIRVYEDPGRAAGDHRVLVDRLWPRGIRKEALDIDEWARDVAPSTDLRRWYGHRVVLFDQFADRYRDQLAQPPGSGEIERLREITQAKGSLVLLTATRDVEHSGAAVLKSVLAGAGH